VSFSASIADFAVEQPKLDKGDGNRNWTKVMARISRNMRKESADA
jgi:hypothetical protein